MKHSIEFLKKAREVGANHAIHAIADFRYKIVVMLKLENGSWSEYKEEWFYSSSVNCEFFDKHAVLIDFSPLEDYYADKALDIAATGISE